MRYSPVLDAYESVFFAGEAVVGVGAGPDLVLRKRTGAGKAVWWGFESREDKAGRGDITALQLLRPRERGGYGRGEVAVVGRANGKLEMVAMRTEGEAGRVGRVEVLQRYETGGLGVKSAALLHRGPDEMMVSAVLGTSGVALYSVRGPGGEAEAEAVAQAPVSEMVLADGEIPWMTAFLSPSLLALGATSSAPLRVFAISAQEGIRRTPVRTFSAVECAGVKTMGVYATAPLPSSIGSAENAGEVFLGGWYDGVSRYVMSSCPSFRPSFLPSSLPPAYILTLHRLHDLRSPAQFVATYADPIDVQTPIYSLCPLGCQRFVVGGGRHCILKIFDLRMGGTQVYDYLGDCNPPTPSPSPESPGWATYLSPPVHRRTFTNAADWESPVYSLALAASGRSVFAGTQGRVWELGFGDAAVAAAVPEAPPVWRDGGGARLTMYEFGWTGTMYRQGAESAMGTAGLEGGRMDGRWCATAVRAG